MASYDTSVRDAIVGLGAGQRPHYPVCTAYSDEIALDPTRRTPKDAGIVQTSARFTALPRGWHIRYTGITTTAKNLILNFERNIVIGGSKAFTFTIPTGGGTHSVRFAANIRYWPWEETNYTRWNVEFDVESVGAA